MRPLWLCLFLTTCGPAFGQSAGGDLARRIANAKPGETIKVAPGSYGQVTLGNVSFAKPVRVISTGADFTGLVLRNVNGLDWVGGTITGSGGRSYGISVSASKHVSFSNVLITGAHRGIVVDRSEGIALMGNTLTGLISDGIDIALSHGVRVERNTCRNFHPIPAVFDAAGNKVKDGDHPDCIQAWSRPGAPPTSDLTIVDNDIEGMMQGIFLGNHVRDGVDDGGFDRVVIRNNRVTIGFGWGIGMSGARDGVVTGNVVRTVPGSTYPNGKPVRAFINVNGERVLACGNSVEGLPNLPAARPCKPPAK